MIDFHTATRQEREGYFDALRDSHRIRIDVKIRDADEKPITSLTRPINRVLSGSVQVDTTADITRSLELTILDPSDRLRFEANSPGQGAVYVDRFISVRYEVWVESADDWVSVPVFWGPLTNFSRSGPEVSLEGQGKESLLLAPHYVGQGYTIDKRTRLDDAIRRVARKMGERRFDLPVLGDKLQEARAITSQEEPWKVLAGGTESRDGKRMPGLVSKAPGDRRVYYDPRGRLTVRKLKTKPVWTFSEGRDLLSHPNISYDITEFRNAVDVTGVAPKGKKRPHARVSLPARHPLSPESLARNGEELEKLTFVETELKTDEECKRRGESTLDRLSKQGVDASFECLPVPHLREGDRVRVRTDSWDLTFPLRTWSLPLSATDSMSIGYTKRTRMWKRKKSSQRMTGGRR